MDTFSQKDRIQQAFALARDSRPAYGALYPLLEGLFILRAEAAEQLNLERVDLSPQVVKAKREGGFPLVNRWDFPLDSRAAEELLSRLKESIPSDNAQLIQAGGRLMQVLADQPSQKQVIWQSFLHHEFEPWQEWIDPEEVDMASLLFVARSCLRPSIEWTAADLSTRFPVPEDWLKGYCPVCGSLPSLLYLEGEGVRKAYCSWCGSHWELHRMQCPYCDNRLHESLGYLAVEAEPLNRVQYCNLCRHYFKLIDTREMIYPPYFPLEEWTTLHLDLIAQRAGWLQPPSPSPQVYGENRD